VTSDPDFEVVEAQPGTNHQAVRRAPHDWIDTRTNFARKPSANGGTTLLFGHEGEIDDFSFVSANGRRQDACRR